MGCGGGAGRPGIAPWIFLSLAFLSFSALSPCRAFAQSLNGTLLWSYSNVDSRVDDAATGSSRAKTDSFNQQYQVYLDTNLTKMLAVRAGGVFQQTDAKVELPDTTSRSTFTRISPVIALSIADPFFSVDASYGEREDKVSSRGGGTFTAMQETWSAGFSMRPAELPRLSVNYLKSYNYDKYRLFRDDVNEFFGVNATYEEIRNLRLQYLFSYGQQNNNLTEVESTRYSNTGRATYGGNFFQNRLTVGLNYQITFGTVETSAPAGGTVTQPVTGFISGYSRPNVPDPLNVTLPADPGVVSGTASLNVGQGARLPPQSITSWDIGLQVSLAGPPGQVNTLFVYVDKDVSPVAGQYRWAVYVSGNNQQWTLHQPAVTAPFNPGDNHFEISFPGVNLQQTPYVKVVVSPLPAVLIPPPPPGSDFTSVFITKVAPFLTVQASTVTGKADTISQQGDFTARVLLLDIPNIYYDFNIFYTRTDPGGDYSYSIYNGLSWSQQFSRVFSGSARVASSRSASPLRSTVDYLYDASVNANPLPTLSHGLSFSGRVTQEEGLTSSANSLYLNNYAKLYEGIDLNLSGGISMLDTASGEKNQGENVSFGLNLVPRPSFSLSVYYSTDWSDRSGGGKPDSSSRSTSSSGSLSWQPADTVYLGATYSIFSASGGPTSKTQNYNINFSPFRGGALQFNFSYAQGKTSPGEQEFTQFTPSARIRLGPATYADVSYQINKSDSPSTTGKADILSATLRTAF